MILRVLAILFILCSLVLGQASIVHNGNNNLIQNGLVLNYGFNEGSNQFVFNRTSTPSYAGLTNLFGIASEQFNIVADSGTAYWAQNGCTATDFFATDPNGNQNAARLVFAGGSNALYFTTTVTNVAYTLSVYAKSNTGSSQAIRLGNASSPGTDQTVTTSWTRLTETFTPTAGTLLVGFTNDAAHDTGDILIYGAQFEVGSSASAYTVPTFNQQLGLLPISDSADPSWVSTGLTYGIDVYGIGVGSVPITFSNISLYAIFKKTGSDAPSFFEPIITMSVGGSYKAAMESRDSLNGTTSANDTGPTFSFAGLGGTTFHARDVKIDDGSWHVFVGTYDGTNVKLYLDGSQVQQFSSPGLSSQTVQRIYTGIFQGFSSHTYYFPGILGGFLGYANAHTATQVRQNTAVIERIMRARGVTIAPPARFIGFEGDSITAGTGLTPNQRWSWYVDQNLSPIVPAWNDAVGGSTIADVESRRTVFSQAINPATPFNLLVLNLGANDLSGSGSNPTTFVADYKTLLAHLRSDGWNKILVWGILPRTDISGFNTRRNTANSLMAADPDFTNGNSADGIITIDPVMMADNAPDVSGMYQSDKVHPNATGCSTYLGPNITTAIQAILP